MTIPTPGTKLATLVAAVHAGDWAGAFAIANRFSDLGEHDAAITRAHEARVRPGFFQEIGRDLELIETEGRAAIYARYGKYLA